MKKSASSAGATRIRPSEPTPVCRLQIAAISEGASESRSSTSSISTKSFPVPLYLPNLISSIAQVLRHLVDHLDRTARTRLEPVYARIATEPRHLPARQRPRAFGGPCDRVLQRELAFEVQGRLSVPDGLARGERRPEPSIEQPPNLSQQPSFELRLDSAFD